MNTKHIACENLPVESRKQSQGTPCFFMCAHKIEWSNHFQHQISTIRQSTMNHTEYLPGPIALQDDDDDALFSSLPWWSQLGLTILMPAAAGLAMSLENLNLLPTRETACENITLALKFLSE